MMTEQQKGLTAALLAPVFLGMAPVLGKFALVSGADAFTVAAIRTALAVGLLWGFYGLFWRRFIYIYPAGLIACVAIGFTNGIGSLFYYQGLDRLDASVAQLLDATYVIFVVLLTRIDGVHVSPLTMLRVGVALFGVLLLTGGLAGDATWLGIGLMLGNALLFGGTVVMSRRILYEMPAQTVTLYVMSAMAAIVVVARLLSSQSFTALSSDATIAILTLAVTTALSRLTLFAGVKGVGSIRTTLLAVGEGAVAVGLAFVFLDERLSVIQWFGVAALVASLFMPADIPHEEERPSRVLPNVAGFRFQRMASSGKLSTQEIRNLSSVLGKTTDKLSTQEVTSLREILGEDGLRQLKEFEQRVAPSDGD